MLIGLLVVNGVVMVLGVVVMSGLMVVIMKVLMLYHDLGKENRNQKSYHH